MKYHDFFRWYCTDTLFFLSHLFNCGISKGSYLTNREGIYYPIKTNQEQGLNRKSIRQISISYELLKYMTNFLPNLSLLVFYFTAGRDFTLCISFINIITISDVLVTSPFLCQSLIDLFGTFYNSPKVYTLVCTLFQDPSFAQFSLKLSLDIFLVSFSH